MVGFLERVYRPFNASLRAVGEVGEEVTGTVGKVFGTTVNGVRRVGNIATRRLNQGVSGLVSKSRKNRSMNGGRRNRSSRKNRSNRSNRNRKNRSARSNRH
jgi:hypothetical protein